MASKFRISGSLLFLASHGLAAEIIIQPQFTGSADYGNNNGQSFLVPSGTTLNGIELHIASGGGSVQVRLWKTIRSNGQLSRSGTQPVATGTIDKSAIIGNTPGWFQIPLTASYFATGNSTEELVFDLLLLTSGTGSGANSGFNNYSFNNTGPYQNGARVNWSTSTSVYTPNTPIDLAFKILGDPPSSPYLPAAVLTLPSSSAQPGQTLTYQLSNSIAALKYALLKSNDLATPTNEWEVVDTKIATGDRLTWSIPFNPAVPRSFFVVRPY